MAEELVELLGSWGASPKDAVDLLRAMMRALPTVVLLPALGFGVLSVPARLALMVVFASAIAPSLAPLAPDASATSALLGELVRGFPVAVVAATGVWAAFMAGDLAGGAMSSAAALRQPMSWLFGLIGAIAFLLGGGASAVAERLASQGTDEGALAVAVDALARGIGIAVVMAAPLLLVSMLVELVLAFAVRGDPRGAWRRASIALRPIVVGLCAALLLERVAERVVQLP